jgi:hypothetical protein
MACKYQEFKSKGLCIQCGATPEAGRSRCVKCKKYMNEYSKNKYNLKVSIGVCVSCGGTEGFDSSFKSCDKCREKDRDRMNTDANKRRLRNYGLVEQDYVQLVERQNGNCAICGLHFDQPLHIDHCHETGKIRGLLCHKCNTGIGLLGDNVEIIRRALRYLDGS